jgi:hypothetical protein
MVSNLDDSDKDIQDTIDLTEEGLFLCKMRGVKFDNASACEGHMAAGHVTPSTWYFV